MKIPLTKPYFTQAEIRNVQKVLNSGWVTQGPMVAEFERELANYLKAKHVLAVSNCTTALHLCMLIGGIGYSDEVIVPSLTYISTVNSAAYVGATPVFADIDLSTYTIDPISVERKITKHTKAIVAVHQIGLAADLKKLRAICTRYKLILIEDAAPALGATYKKEMVGEKGKFITFSFHPRKSITTGEGGAIATEDADVAKRVKVLRSHGASISDFSRHKKGKPTFEQFKELGYNYRLSDIQAAVGLAQLQKLPRIIEVRRKLAKHYWNELHTFPQLRLPIEPSDRLHTFQSYQIRFEGITSAKRDAVMERLLQKGISTRRGVMAAHLEPLYRMGYNNKYMGQTEKASRESLLLPLFPQMTENEQLYVIESLRQTVKELHL